MSKKDGDIADKIARQIDPDGTFLDECEEAVDFMKKTNEKTLSDDIMQILKVRGEGNIIETELELAKRIIEIIRKEARKQAEVENGKERLEWADLCKRKDKIYEAKLLDLERRIIAWEKLHEQDREIIRILEKNRDELKTQLEVYKVYR